MRVSRFRSNAKPMACQSFVYECAIAATLSFRAFLNFLVLCVMLFASPLDQAIDDANQHFAT